MALAGDKDDIVGPRKAARGLDRLFPVGLDVDTLRRLGAGEDFVDDCDGVLRAGVVAGDEDDVGQFLGHLAHAGALGAVAVSAAAEDDDETPVGKGLQRGEDLFQPVVGMSVIDEGGEGPGLLYAFEAPRDALEGEDPGGGLLERRAERGRGRRGGEML